MSTMKKQKQVKKSSKNQNTPRTDWFSHMLDDKPKLAVPVGPRFQADVPEWTGPPQKKYPHKTPTKSSSSKWLGTVTWPNKHTTPATKIGKGRPDHCSCYIPGSILCIQHHISEKSAQLQKDLGPAFQKWKFDEMGEAVAKLWKQTDQQKFSQIVKTNPVSEGKNFIKPALESFPSKSRSSIVSYYFNVHLPRRISMETGSGCTSFDTDDEDEKKNPCSKGSRKRAQADVLENGSKIMKVAYLTGRR